MSRARWALVAVGTWLVTVVLVGGLVWVTVLGAESRTASVTLTDAGATARPVGAGSGTGGDVIQPTAASPTAPTDGAGTAGRRPGAIATTAPTAGTRAPERSPRSAPASASSAAGSPGGSSSSSARSRPARTSSGGDPRSGTVSADVAATTTPFRTSGGQVLISCSLFGISDLRAITELGWSGRWSLTGRDQITVWFTSEGGGSQQLTVSCVAGSAAADPTTHRDHSP